MSNIKRVLLSGMLFSSLALLPITAFASSDKNNDTLNNSKEKTEDESNSNMNNGEAKNGNEGIGSNAYKYLQSKKYKTAYESNSEMTPLQQPSEKLEKPMKNVGK